jgi:hypothetical protein
MRLATMTCIVLAGCGGDGGVDPDAPDPCGAGAYQALAGANIAAVTLPADLQARVLGPDDVVTLEYVADRLTIRTDRDGIILDLSCG